MYKNESKWEYALQKRTLVRRVDSADFWYWQGQIRAWGGFSTAPLIEEIEKLDRKEHLAVALMGYADAIGEHDLGGMNEI